MRVFSMQPLGTYILLSCGINVLLYEVSFLLCWYLEETWCASPDVEIVNHVLLLMEFLFAK